MKVDKSTKKDTTKDLATESAAVKNEDKEFNLEEALVAWKAEFGNIYKNDINEDEFVIWRPIRRKEYKQLLETKDDGLEILNRQEEVCKAAILFPLNADELIDSKAGLATALSEEILAHSGFEISETKPL